MLKSEIISWVQSHINYLQTIKYTQLSQNWIILIQTIPSLIHSLAHTDLLLPKENKAPSQI